MDYTPEQKEELAFFNQRSKEAMKFYLPMMLKLLAACIEHGNDSDEAEAIRNQMDNNTWYHMTVTQQDELRKLSADVQRLEKQIE